MSDEQGLMEDVMDLQFCLQALIKQVLMSTDDLIMSKEHAEYLLSDKFSSKIGSMEEANDLWVPKEHSGSGSTP